MEGFGKREGPAAEKWETREEPVDADAVYEFDAGLIFATVKKYTAVRDIVAEAVENIDPKTSDDYVEQIAQEINHQTKTEQGTKLHPENIRRYLESLRPKGRGR